MECKQNDTIRFSSGYFQHNGTVEDREGDLVWAISDEGERFLITIGNVLEVIE